MYLVSPPWVAAVVVSAHQFKVLNRFDLVLVVPRDAREPCAQVIVSNFRDKVKAKFRLCRQTAYFFTFRKKIFFIENAKTSIFLFILENRLRGYKPGGLE